MALTGADAVLATNTSYLDVGQIAQSLPDPSRLLGLHFFSPAHIMKLLEIVRPPKVADDVLATGLALAKRLGKIAVPSSRDERAADVTKRIADEDAGQDDYDAIRYQGNYVKELIAETDYPSFDVDGANEAFFQWKKYKKEDIMTFRNHGHKSALTGSMAPEHHTPWKDALDDSLEAYLKT